MAYVLKKTIIDLETDINKMVPKFCLINFGFPFIFALL